LSAGELCPYAAVLSWLFLFQGHSPTQSENDIGSHSANIKPSLSGGMSFSLFLFANMPSGIWKYLFYLERWKHTNEKNPSQEPSASERNVCL